jgi:hypothetical protein
VGSRGNAGFHETRLRTYTDFLDEVSNAMGYQLHQAIHKNGQPAEEAKGLGDLTEADLAAGVQIPPAEHPEFNQDAPRRMLRLQHVVMMLASSPDMRSAATDLVYSVLLLAAVPGDDPNRSERLMELVTRQGQASDRFIAAVAELVKAGETNGC